MKNILLLGASLLSVAYSYSQGNTSLNTYGMIDTNNIAAGFNTAGDLFSKDTILPGAPSTVSVMQEFRVPKSGPAHAIFDGNIWVAAKNNGNLYCSSAQYTSTYRPGPADLLPQDSAKWSNIWSISRSDVLSVKNDFDLHHAITLAVPASVLGWPAKGNASAVGSNGASLVISEDMAPFVDRNGDGLYNVYDGDYPLMKGDIMLWWINNDMGSQSQNPMGIDRRYSVYEYGSPGDSNLNNTLFMSVRIKNQSSRAYDSLTIGAFVDFDLGCANNDRVGSIPTKNTMFVYNGYVQSGVQFHGITCDEGPVCPSSEVGYGCTLPIMTATFLNDTMKCFNYSMPGMPPGQGDPNTDVQYYRYMNGQWNDGTPLTFGGNGYLGTMPYPFAFPGNPADASQWSECNTQTSQPLAAGDRMSYAAIGPFSLPAGDTISFDMAFIFHPDSVDNCPDLSDSSNVVQHIDSIAQYYASETFPGWYDSTKALAPAYYTLGINEVSATPFFSVIPNPNYGNFNIHFAGSGLSQYSVTVTDMLGRVVYYTPYGHSPDQMVQMTEATSGVYSVTIEADNYRATKKVVITK